MQERTEDVSRVREEDEGLENEETTELESVEETAEPEDSSPKNESARETVERLLRDAERENSGSEDEGEEEQEQVRDVKTKKEKLPDIEPPARFNAEEKQVFNKLPRRLKDSLNKMLGDHQAHFTRQTQQLSQAQREAQSIVEAVRPYLHANPELLERGYTESKIVGGLIAAHQRLSDPRTALTAYLELGKQIGVDDEMLETLQARYQKTKNQPHQADVTNHPQFRAMQEELNRVKSYTDGLQSQSFNQNVNKIVQEIEQVRNEKDALGNYVFPKMHDEEFLERVKPLVQTLRGNLPNASYGELFRRAYQVLEGGNSSAQPSRTRLPNQVNNRATQAAVSVRGKSAPSSGSSYEEDIPNDALANPRATVEWAIKQFRR